MSQPSPPEVVRDLDWDGCLNVRDLGGHRTSDGGETRWRSVVRADSIRRLTEAGWQAAVDYGVRTAIDLRGEHELADDPPGEIAVEVLHVPFMEANKDDWRRSVVEMEAIARRSEGHAEMIRDFYLLFLERFRENAGASLKALAHAPEGGVVVHCMGGKDRTGLLCAFLLHLAGVDEAEIAADYAVSEARLRPRHDAWLAEAETEAERERIRRISRTPAEAMLGVFAELRRRYGSVAEYLRGAGLDDRDLELARARLR